MLRVLGDRVLSLTTPGITAGRLQAWKLIFATKPPSVPDFLMGVALAGSSEAGEGNTVKLCGRDFVRAVVFTCGGSRWKRHLTDYHYLSEGIGKHPLTRGLDPRAELRPSSCRSPKHEQLWHEGLCSEAASELLQLQLARLSLVLHKKPFKIKVSQVNPGTTTEAQGCH
uniref:Uncharacterized protein n=1 Tax=Otus sunia TaxID=257818 RepID=A0A8C8B037_9STRI